MAEVYIINKDDWSEDEVELVIENDYEAYTEDFELEIEWDEGGSDYGEMGVGYLDGQKIGTVIEDREGWVAYDVYRGTRREDDDEPFIALAAVAYSVW